LRKLTGDLTQGSMVITGTNGKTTTARLLATMLEGAGLRVVSNRSGANLIFGATAAALRSAGPDGRLRADWGVFEIDEASLPNGDFARPAPSVAATEITLNGFDSLEMTVAGTPVRLPVGGLYNAYNALAAFAAGDVIGLDRDFMAGRMHDFKAAFGRQERLDFRGRHLVLVLSKNPAGFNETLRT